MRKRACWQEKCSWNAESSMTPAKPLREWRCFTMIRPSLRAHWTRRRWRIDKQAKPRKPTGCRTSCASDIRITPADSPIVNRNRLFRGAYSRDTPGTVAYFDAAQFFARFHIDDCDIIRRSVRGVE